MNLRPRYSRMRQVPTWVAPTATPHPTLLQTCECCLGVVPHTDHDEVSGLCHRCLDELLLFGDLEGATAAILTVKARDYAPHLFGPPPMLPPRAATAHDRSGMPRQAGRTPHRHEGGAP